MIGSARRVWDLPHSIQLVRDRILKQPKGDRTFVELLLDGKVSTTSVVMYAMRRLIAPTQPVAMNVPDMLKLKVEPLADCGRYDRLRGVSHVIH